MAMHVLPDLFTDWNPACSLARMLMVSSTVHQLQQPNCHYPWWSLRCAGAVEGTHSCAANCNLSLPLHRLPEAKPDPLGRKVLPGALDARQNKAAKKNARRAAKRLEANRGRGSGRGGGFAACFAQDSDDDDTETDGSEGSPERPWAAGLAAATKAGRSPTKAGRSPPAGMGPVVHGQDTRLMEYDPRLNNTKDEEADM